MKKPLLALAALSALGSYGAAQAESNVNIYGLIDATISTVNNENAKGERLTGFQTPWFSGSRLGFKGAEDLGGGLKAIFKLESEYVIQTGEFDDPSQLFGRDAWVGVESESLGKLTVGYQNAIGRDFAASYLDPYGSAKVGTDEGGGTNTNNFKQMIFYAGAVNGKTRMSNSIVWKKAFSNGLVAGLGYQLGEVVGDLSTNTTKSAALGYNGSNFSVSSFYIDANVNNETHQSWSVGGSYSPLDVVRVNAGYFHYTADQGLVGERKDDGYTVSAKFTPAGVMDYELGYQVMKANNAAFNKDGSSTLTAFKDASAATATGTGRKSTLYGSLFYHLSKRTELYAAADYMKLKDGFRVGSANGFANQTELAVGMRTRF